MITLRPSGERGVSRYDWLDSRHTFSFDRYYDPRHVSFRSLRVINEDHVAAGAGFPTHGHKDMEILTYMLGGRLAHKDSTGTGSEIGPGDVQRMSAGTGITHSEFNASDEDPAHLLQIWILPERRGIVPGYEERHFAAEQKLGRLRLIASRDARDGSLAIQQDASVYAAVLEPGGPVVHRLAPGRAAWVQVARGAISVNGQGMTAGDGASAGGEERLEIRAAEPSEILLFDLA